MNKYLLMNPLVSICIPTYNSEKYIEKMLLSIIDQTYPNIEVIICDNCSSDNTFQILELYSTRKKWKIIRNEVNIGALNNMSKLIKMATGKYTALYHSDDLYEPTIVEKSVHILENDLSLSMVSTLGYSIDNEDNIIGAFSFPEKFLNKKSIPFSLIFEEILSLRPFFLITPSVLTRSIYYQENTEFKKKYGSAADYGKWFEILQKGDLYLINENLIRYRTHDQQGSQTEIKGNYNIPDSIPLYEDYSKKNNELYWELFKYSYFKLMLIQAIKLNNLGKFKRSQIFLKLIIKRSKKNIFPWIITLCFFNAIKVKLSLNKLLAIKQELRKLK